MDEIEIQYEDKFVAFVDILGFKNMVINNEIDKITMITRAFQERVLINKKDHDINFDKNVEITSISDSIIISYPASDYNGQLLYLLLDLIYIQLNLLSKGILLRGGISFGEVYHKGNIIVGPAYLDAYALEHEIAIYPRIILNESVINSSINNYDPVHSSSDSKEYLNHVLSCLHRCEDGFYCIDIFNQEQECDDLASYNELLSKVKPVIELNISNKDIKVQQKYNWLKNQFNRVMRKLRLACSHDSDYKVYEEFYSSLIIE